MSYRESTYNEADDADENSSDAPTPLPPNSHQTLTQTPSSAATPIDDIDDIIDDDDDDDSTNPILTKKQKPLSSLSTPTPPPSKKPTKKKTNNSVWTYKSTSRKGKKKTKPSPKAPPLPPEDTVLITPVPRFPTDKSDDSPSLPISLSRVHKAERVDLSDDRLSASSSKGYRMVRATRGVLHGHWYFEIKVLRLGPTGHVRLGWATEKGDLQAPVGYDGSSYGYRDVDGSKVHRAQRERYSAEGYGEGDVIGFYIGLPDGERYAPKPPHLVWYKGQRYMYNADGKDDLPKDVPGSEISFFKNGVCQGTAFKDISGGRYYPAASMYTMPNEPNCEVRFNFGPGFDFFPEDFGGRQTPRPMIEVPYHGHDVKVESPLENGLAEKLN
ncbi:putative protein TRAUCO [Iris pallida]|uniref:B30.2/SPRY domain-containing protein n=1 Tax=Iris pallida TaxID=29817 RepID=A0AAX6EC20_IRIPA|nr:putative protein TRAUCO [Iris pallida]KAJ6801647.1 putative protein TRAUCO [Iris pallida]